MKCPIIPLPLHARATFDRGWCVACVALLLLALPCAAQTKSYSFPTGANSWTTYTPDADTRSFGSDNGDGTQTVVTVGNDDDDGPEDGEEDE